LPIEPAKPSTEHDYRAFGVRALFAGSASLLDPKAKSAVNSRPASVDDVIHQARRDAS
jgi:hypothetical protein